MKKICILDYGSGNVRSVYNLIKYLNYESIRSNDSKEIKKSTHIILPGVGAFGAAMKKINEKISIEILEDEVINKKKPFLGICVGMQLLAEKSEEFGEHKGPMQAKCTFSMEMHGFGPSMCENNKECQ